MPELPLPDDLPRLYTIRTMLLTLLTAANRAIEEAEDPRPKPTSTPRRWCIVWRWAPASEAVRRGILHTADCMLAAGEPINAQQVQAERRGGRRIDMCETCRPQLP